MEDVDINRLYWEASKRRIVDGIEGFAQSWTPNGAAEHVKDAIVRFIQDMPAPVQRKSP